MIAFLVLIAALALVAMTLGAPSAQSASAKDCPLSPSQSTPGNGKPTYNFNPKAKGTSCGTAIKVMKGFQACRSKSKFTCSKKVLSKWKCTGKKVGSTNPVTGSVTGSFTCKYKSATVTGKYQQDK